jgi:hypothetical protein
LRSQQKRGEEKKDKVVKPPSVLNGYTPPYKVKQEKGSELRPK